MPARWWSDDDRLLGTLGDALDAGEVPPAMVEAGRRAFAAHDLDAQFAALIYDSDLDPEAGADLAEAVTRADPAPLRALTFGSATLMIELEVTGDAILGQLVPPQPGTVDVAFPSGAGTSVAADDVGCFTIRPIPTGQIRLLCRTATGLAAVTDWINF